MKMIDLESSTLGIDTPVHGLYRLTAAEYAGVEVG